MDLWRVAGCIYRAVNLYLAAHRLKDACLTAFVLSRGAVCRTCFLSWPISTVDGPYSNLTRGSQRSSCTSVICTRMWMDRWT